MVGKKKPKQSLNARIGANIVRFRDGLGWSQEFLAERMGINPETISRYERGLNLPSLKTLEQMAHVLNKSISEIVSEGAPIATNDLKALSALFVDLSDQERTFLLDQLKHSANFIRARRS